MTTVRRHSFSSWESVRWNIDKNKITVTPLQSSLFKSSSKSRIIKRPVWNSSTKFGKMSSSQNSIDLNISASILNSTLKSGSNQIDENDDIPGIQIYNLWREVLSKDKMSSDIAWNRCRRLAYDALDLFTQRIEGLENILKGDVSNFKILELDSVLEKKNELDAALFELEDLDIEMKQVSKAFQTVAQCLPPCATRETIKETMKESRLRYFRLLNNLSHKKEIFRSLDPLLRQYKELHLLIICWLDDAEKRCQFFIGDYNNHDLIMENEETIENTYAELSSQKDTYENFLEAGESLCDLIFDQPMTDIKETLSSITNRWDLLCSNLEKCLNRLEIAKELALKSKKGDIEKIENQIRCEERRCTCHTPFQIKRFGEGKYKFGNSKIIRLVRIHGSSIVVRVGGGWEFLYEFLLKADPCRAQQLAENSNLSTLDLSGLDLNPIDNKTNSEFTFTVRRFSLSNYSPQHRLHTRPVINGSLDSANSSDNGCDESNDSLSFPNNNNFSTPKPRPKSFISTSLTVPLRKQSINKKISKSNENLTRRLSLIERQIDFAEKQKKKKEKKL
ncbi:uncharacterized protein LOC100201523 isoform X1 [Hydra vulgaris]|uniref:uncharacterized protein LOC100201523 isoform X1 n=2 Tax=Hydra vulgaris TaxID=6087 RepID=UPI000192542A|nr:golgin candidate 5 isoform X1 [Hydra vulgaris]XP_047126567.1 golgin candidate 5 isoform X1 [Hydra vulgaris]